MTKKHHVCDENCRINHRKKPKKYVETDFGNVPIGVKSKPEVVNIYKVAPKSKHIIEIMNIVDEIANENETNKVLEKTLITLRKLQKDIAN